MLSLNEFTVATLAGAPHMSLVVPHDERSGSFLPLRLKSRGTFTVFLTGEDRFKFFHYERRDDEEDAHFLKGIVISGIAFELDETSVYDPDNGNRVSGSLIRTQDRLEIVAKSARERIGQPLCLAIMTDLPPARSARGRASLGGALSLGNIRRSARFCKSTVRRI